MSRQEGCSSWAMGPGRQPELCQEGRMGFWELPPLLESPWPMWAEVEPRRAAEARRVASFMVVRVVITILRISVNRRGSENYIERKTIGGYQQLTRPIAKKKKRHIWPCCPVPGHSILFFPTCPILDSLGGLGFAAGQCPARLVV